VRARREALVAIGKKPDTHAGLWMDKYLQHQTAEDDQDQELARGAESDLLGEVASIKTPDLYRAALRKRLQFLKDGNPGRHVVVAKARALGRSVVGLGQKGPTEIGICLEHTWGVPMLPGSSLKGVAAAAAHLLHGGADWKKAVADDGKPVDREPNSFDWLFGTNEEKGAVSFLDAWFDPEASGDKPPLDLDVMTVHHQSYYSGKVNPSTRDVYPPSDMDSPNPVSFLSTSGTFVVVLEGEKAWVEAAYQLLAAGLETLGIGAKTNAGYGRFKLEREKTTEELQQEHAVMLVELAAAKKREQDAELAKRWAGLDSLVGLYKGASNATDVFRNLLKAAKDGCPLERLQGIALQLNQKDKKFWKEWRKKENRTPEEQEYFDKLFKPPGA
jgi:CRISPR-associated protein Cmr6